MAIRPKETNNSVIRTAIIGSIIFIGLVLRLYHVGDNQFLFYDEGMYLSYNRAFLDLVANNPAHDPHEFGIILSIMIKTALSTAKALWFLLLNLRVFIWGAEAWSFARWISAVSGIATVILLFYWARRYLKSKRIALLSALILLVLPSHVFYSRLGMQESLSTLLFLGAIYLYMTDEKVHWRFFLSAFILACVYLTNYRMIIAPVFIAFIECFHALVEHKKLDWKKAAIYFCIFYGVALFVGCLYGGTNLKINLAWMTHQAQDAGGKFNPVNFISYPFYVFALEGFFFACFFWGNIYLVKAKEFSKLLPFGIVVFQMFIFSFAAEKGARYLCVVLPFMAAAAAVVVDDCWERFIKLRPWVLSTGFLALLVMLYLSVSIALARTDYENAVRFIIDRDRQAIIVSTQPLVEGLYLSNDKQMLACPNDLGSLFELYKKGARYLILDPQAYVSWTADGKRFSPPLDRFLEIPLKEIAPLQTYPHLNTLLLTRLVLDHNEQIMDSLAFLSHARSEGYGKIRVYDLGLVLQALEHAHAAGTY